MLVIFNGDAIGTTIDDGICHNHYYMMYRTMARGAWLMMIIIISAAAGRPEGSLLLGRAKTR